MKYLIVISAMLLTGCLAAMSSSGAYKAYDSLTAQEQDLYNRCRNKVEEARCYTGFKNGSDEKGGLCSNPLIEEYGNAKDKKKWLVQNGCPPYMVN